MALFTDDPLAGGVEFTDADQPGYARQLVTFGASSAGVMSNSAAVTFGPAEADWVPALYAGFYEQASGGTLKRYGVVGGTLAERTVAATGSLQFPIAAVTWREVV